MTYKDRYAELKAQHRCVNCKKALPADYRRVSCEHNLEFSRESHRRKDELKKKRQSYASAKPRTTTGLTISQVVRMAAERHVSYGEMVCLLEKEGMA